MAAGKATPERLAAFSDGVIAIIITIMVLELKTPRDASPEAFLVLWPVFLSYALSYLLVGIVWVNHHHLLRYTDQVDSLVIWANLAFLFFVSLIPFFTEYMAANRMNPFTTALYAGIFLLMTLAFMLLQRSITRQFSERADLQEMTRAATWRNWIALTFYTLAIPAAYLYPALSLVLVLGVSLLYFVPNAARCAAR